MKLHRGFVVLNPKTLELSMQRLAIQNVGREYLIYQKPPDISERALLSQYHPQSYY